MNELKSNHANAKDIIEGIYDIALGLKGMPEAMHTCKSTEEEIIKVEAALKKMGSVKAIVWNAGK